MYISQIKKKSYIFIISVCCPTRRKVPPVLNSIFKFRTLTPNTDIPILTFFSRCKIGQLNGNEVEEYARRRPGVYFRLERDLYSRVDQMGIEMRERAKWDIRESMVGTETFEPKHIIIATWKNVSFAGGITSANRIVILKKLNF